MQILCNDVIFKSQNPGEVDICTITNNRLGMIKCAKNIQSFPYFKTDGVTHIIIIVNQEQESLKVFTSFRV